MRTFAQKQKPTQQTKSANSTRPGRAFSGQCREVHSILHLQRTIGNQAVQRLLKTAQDKENCDRVAPPIVREVLQSPGQPLHLNTRAFFEQRFGHDFSKVQVHTGSRASASAEAVNATAYTVKDHVVLSAGSMPSRHGHTGRVLAHELMHVMQWGDRPIPAQLSIAPADGLAERQAHAAGAGTLTSTTSLQRAVPVCHEWRRQDTGRGNPGPGINVNVSVSGQRADVNARLQVHGTDADAAKATRIQNTISNNWTGNFPDGYRANTNVRATHRAPGQSEDSTATQIELMRSGHGTASRVSRHWVVGSRYMSLDLDNANALNWEAAHEFGHLLGLRDRYSESFWSRLRGAFGFERSPTVPDPGYENNIMATVNGRLESANVQALIARYVDYECLRWRVEI